MVLLIGIACTAFPLATGRIFIWPWLPSAWMLLKSQWWKVNEFHRKLHTRHSCSPCPPIWKLLVLGLGFIYDTCDPLLLLVRSIHLLANGSDKFKCPNPTNICWSSRHVLKTFSRPLARRLGRRKIVTLKTSSRRLGGKQNFYWWYLYLTNLNVYLTNLYFTNYI